MASPQLQKGFARIANEILDHIARANLNGTQFKIIMVLWRFTYGFGEKITVREISLSFLAKRIDSTKSHVDRELSSLINRKIIDVVEVVPRRGRILSFNKNYEEWDKPLEQAKEIKVEKEAPKTAKPKGNRKIKYPEDNTYYKMALYFHEKVSLVAKEANVEHLIRKANLQKWADEFRKLIELDGVDKRLAKEVMDWTTKDVFWKTNVLSAKKLREKFGELAIKMKASQTSKKPSQPRQNDIRDKEIEFQKWVEEGNDPDAFDWRS